MANTTTDNHQQAWEKDPFVYPWPEMRPFWAAAAEGKFLMPKCGACSKFHWHPRAICPFCHSNKIEWIESEGRGTIFSFSIARYFSPQHANAFVKTKEGPVILTQLVDCTFEELRIDMPVRVKLAPVPEGRTMPFFTPER